MNKIIFFLWCLTPSLILAQAIPDFSANYAIYYGNIQVGDISEKLTTLANGERHYYSQSRARGAFAFFKPDVITEISQWQEKQHQITPILYRYQRQGGKKQRDIILNFQPPATADSLVRTVNITRQGHRSSNDVTINTIDKLHYRLALMADLQHNKATLQYDVIDHKKQRQYILQRGDTELLTTPLGKLSTIKIHRSNQNNQRHTILWCAPALAYLPVKLSHTEKDGRQYTAILRQLTGLSGLKAKSHEKTISNP